MERINGKNGKKDMSIDFEDITSYYREDKIEEIADLAYTFYAESLGNSKLSKCDISGHGKILRVWDSAGNLYETKIPNNNTTRMAAELFARALSKFGGLHDGLSRFAKHKNDHMSDKYRNHVNRVHVRTDQINMLAKGGNEQLLDMVKLGQTSAAKAVSETVAGVAAVEAAAEYSEKESAPIAIATQLLQQDSAAEIPKWQQLAKDEKAEYVEMIIGSSVKLALSNKSDEEIYKAIQEEFKDRLKISPQTLDKLIKEHALSNNDVYTLIETEGYSNMEPFSDESVVINTGKIVSLLKTEEDGRWTKLADGSEVLGDYVIEQQMKAYTSAEENKTTIVQEIILKYNNE